MSSPVSDASPLLHIEGLTKRFGPTLALDGVDFELRPGELHMLLGENGAGKSTLIKILAGVYGADAGTIRFRSEEVKGTDHLPIAFIHQDLALVEDMTVAENIALLEGYPKRGSLISWKQARRQAARALASIDSALPVDAPVNTLSTAEKSMVAIARAVATSPEILVLDEPTAALPNEQVEKLFAALRRLRSEGVGLIYVTHRLDEIGQIADRVTVLRDGCHISTRSASAATSQEIVADIVGPEMADEFRSGARERRPELADVRRAIALRELRIGFVGPLSVDIYSGEVVGFVGLLGAGHQLVGRAIAGDMAWDDGEINLADSKIVPGQPVTALSAGIGFLSSKRLDEGILAPMTVRENLFASQAIRRRAKMVPWITPRRERTQASEVMRRFSVRPTGTERLITSLSGGNQQKVLLARAIFAGSQILVLEEPTAGIDIRAKRTIHAMMRQVADEGRAVILVSSDFEEITAACDRAVIFSRGQIADEITGDELTERRLIAATGGAKG